MEDIFKKFILEFSVEGLLLFISSIIPSIGFFPLLFFLFLISFSFNLYFYYKFKELEKKHKEEISNIIEALEYTVKIKPRNKKI